ncbi:hypothetical protein [Shouchella hunanensis]|uniref:Uncharacterized protein n=1 Tax=Shouchella hunanensis TaxID=766894 RepID=A0ABY7VZC2_9BACI|nr:hypothetical protein [Shouchella hunanensis]WDF02012.1 hypothetical protein PQ477_10790 [Shouchella hunanensis]
MATIYRTYQRRMHGGVELKPIETAITYAISSHNNIPVSVYNCGPCYASCGTVDIRLQRMVTSAVYETVGTRLNRRYGDTRICPARSVEETFTNVRKSSAPMRVLWTLEGINETSPTFYHA